MKSTRRFAQNSRAKFHARRHPIGDEEIARSMILQELQAAPQLSKDDY